jgi:hypothetical protein
MSRLSGRSQPKSGQQKKGRRYRHGEHGQTEGYGSYRGNHFCDEKLVEPSKLSFTFKEGEASTTTLRVLPNYNVDYEEGSDLPKWDPFLLPDEEDFGDFIRSYWAMRGIGGKNGITYLIFDPLEDGNENKGKDFAYAESPGGLLYAGLKNAIKNKKEKRGWAGLLERGDQSGAIIIPPKKISFIQALVFEHGSKTMEVPKGLADEDKRIPLIDLGADAGVQMMNLFEERWTEEEMVKHKLDPDDPINWHKIGRDPISWARGLFLRFFPVGHDPRVLAERGRERQRSRSMSGGSRQAGADKGGNDRKGFDLFAEREFNDMSAVIPKGEIREKLQKKVVPWDQVFLFPTLEEQAKLLQGRGIPFNLMEYCWRDHPEWIPEHDSDDAREGRGAVSSGWRKGQKDDEDDEDQEDREDEDGDEDDDRTRSRSKKDLSVEKYEEDEEDDEEDEAPKGRKSSNSSRSKARDEEDDQEDDEEEEDGEAAKPKGPRNPKSPRNRKDLTVPDDEEDDEPKKSSTLDKLRSLRSAAGKKKK